MRLFLFFVFVCLLFCVFILRNFEVFVKDIHTYVPHPAPTTDDAHCVGTCGRWSCEDVSLWYLELVVYIPRDDEWVRCRPMVCQRNFYI